MARANNDVRQLSDDDQPGVVLIIDSFSALIVPIIFIGFLKWQLAAGAAALHGRLHLRAAPLHAAS